MAGPRLPAIWSPEALGDLDQLWDYYAGVAGRTTADKIIRGIDHAVMTISDLPFAGRGRDEIRPGLRSLAVSPHVILYRLNGSRPEIVRVLDGRRDIDEIFSDG